MLLVASETGHVYTFATRKLQPMIISDAGKALIQTCLNSPDSDNLLMSAATAMSDGGLPSCSNQHLQPPNQSPMSNGSSASSSSASSSSTNTTTHGPCRQTINSPLGRQLSPSSSNSQIGCISPAVNQNLAQNAQCSPISSNQNSPKGSTLVGSANQQTVDNHRDSCSNGSNNVAVQSQQNMLIASGSNSGPTHLSMQHQHSNTSSDQRMSATGFEETDLSYSITDDLGDRVSKICQVSELSYG